MQPLSYDQLTQFLKDEGYTPEFQKDSEQICIQVACDGHDLPTFFRINEEGPVLQVVTFVPVQYSDKTVSDTARMLHLINKEIDLPGFGMDELSATVFYRTVVPCLDKKFDPELIRAGLKALKVISDNFLNAVNAVALGAITFEDAVKRAMEAEQAKT